MLLKRKHVVTHHDVLGDTLEIYFSIVDPKTKRLALRQHFKIADQVVVQYICWAIRGLELEDPLYDGSPAMFRLRWNRLCEHLHLPFATAEGGVTPGCLRGSGATYFYKRCEDIPRLAWRGRWFRATTLEHYLQEVAGQVLSSKLSENERRVLKELAELALPSLISYVTAP